MNVIRPRVTKFAVIGVAAISVVALVSAAFSGNWSDWLRVLDFVAFFAACTWLFFVEPRIKFDEKGVEIVNPLRRLKAGWGAVVDFETKYGLTVVTEGRKFVAWAAPSPTRLQARRIDRHEVKGGSQEGLPYIEPGKLESSDSGSALVQLELARSQSANASSDYTVSTNWLGVIGCCAVIALGYVALHY
jgi:hypothetical protein